jgi:single-strand DNA-binding protein
MPENNNRFNDTINQVTLIGRLGKKPELRFTPNGSEVTTLSVATNQSIPDGNGGWTSVAEWHNVEVWGAQAVSCCDYLDKGSKVYVEGRNKVNVKGEGEERKYFPFVKASKVLFLSTNGGGTQIAEVEEAHDASEEIPF